jgi:hypothetical protein
MLICGSIFAAQKMGRRDHYATGFEKFYVAHVAERGLSLLRTFYGIGI